MKKLAVICFLLVSLRASGDLVVVEQISEPRQQIQTITIKAKGDKYREDLPNNTSDICDLVSGDIIQLDHSAKNFRKIPAALAEALQKKFQNATGTKPGKPPAIVDTGKSEKVDGHDAEIYTAVTAAATYTYWVTKDYPNYSTVSEEMKKIQERSAHSQANNLMPDSSKLDGLVIKSQRLSSGGEVTTVTLASAKEEAVDDSEFQPPQGYTEIPPQGQ